VSAIAFRSWLVDRYGDIDELNDAWGTAFWSQRYGSFDEVLPPRAAPAFVNPTQQLDFRRFSSDEHLACFVAERDILRRLTPEVPVTTNFMTHKDVVDYWSWAAEVDVVANDHYIDPSDPESHVGLAFCADLTRGLAGGKPWLLMEHSTSAVNWRARNAAKQPGQMLRNSLQHLCRGADGIMFFQWRASEAGAEKFHSAMVPHAGPDSRVFREVCQLGSQVAALGDVAGSVVSADVAIVFDYQSWWASGLDAHPTVDVDYPGQALELYRALWSRNITVDFVRPGTDLAAYHLVVVPNLYLVEDQAARLLAEYVDSGGHLVVTYFSGIVDEHDHVRLGGYPGAFRELLGIRTEEFFPLAEGQCVSLSDGSTATVWTERTHVNDADVLARFVDGPAPGSPAVTRRRTDTGSAWYLGTRLHRSSTQRWVDTIVQEAGVVPGVAAPEGLEVVTRHGDDWSYTFAINHTDGPLDVELASGLDLLEDMEVEGRITVAPGSVRVLRHARHGAGCS
jgi:beta-galactosidase